MRTLDDFRETILARLSCRQRNDPAYIAHLFVRYFRVSVRPGFEELIKVLEEAGVASVLGQKLPGGLRGTHFSLDKRHYSIRYSTDQWEGGKNHTVLHETYEIIHEMLSDQEMEPSPSRKLCWDADYFAASVLMQPAVFAPFAKASGLDIIALRSQFECSYASVTLRLAEVMRNQPLMGVLYQRQEQGNPAEWTEPPDRRQFRATISDTHSGLRHPGSSRPLWFTRRHAPQGHHSIPSLDCRVGGAQRQGCIRRGGVHASGRTKRRHRHRCQAGHVEGTAGEGCSRGRALPATRGAEAPDKQRSRLRAALRLPGTHH